MPSDFCIVLTTSSTREKAQALAKALVEMRLAACVQMLAVESLYTWQGRLEEAAEILLLVKIRRADYAQVEQTILALHDYETPEVIALPIEQGSAGYLDWIAAVTRRNGR